jgi:lipoate-protein ligase A
LLFLNHTAATPEENLALDEALLDQAEASLAAREAGESDPTPWLAAHDGEVLRLWEAPAPFVVLGSSSKFSLEANIANCRTDGVPILRRASGGAAIVTGPGCLMYGAVLSYHARPALRDLDAAHRFMMHTLTRALSVDGLMIAVHGICDLVHDGRKFSGNSLRCKRQHLLYHGTLLYDYQLSHIARYLGTPARMPEYRAGRAHESFVTNLPVPRERMVMALREAFAADAELPSLPTELTQKLVEEKYLLASWTERFS